MPTLTLRLSLFSTTGFGQFARSLCEGAPSCSGRAPNMLLARRKRWAAPSAGCGGTAGGVTQRRMLTAAPLGCPCTTSGTTWAGSRWPASDCRPAGIALELRAALQTQHPIPQRQAHCHRHAAHALWHQGIFQTPSMHSGERGLPQQTLISTKAVGRGWESGWGGSGWRLQIIAAAVGVGRIQLEGGSSID